MNYSKSHLSDDSLKNELAAAIRRERGATVEVLAHIAEFIKRRLFAKAGYSSMHAYCVGKLGLSEQAAFRRVTAARAARRFPEILDAFAEGRLHLTAILLIAQYLRAENASELIALATHRTRREIETVLASRFPRPDMPTVIRPLRAFVSGSSPEASKPSAADPAAGSSFEISAGANEATSHQASEGQESESAVQAPGETQLEVSPESRCQEPSLAMVPDISTPAPPPPSPQPTQCLVERFSLQVTIDRETRELLQRAEDLLGARTGPGDVGQVLKRALTALIAQLESRKFAATPRPRPRRFEPPNDRRTISAGVKRAVWKRDGGRCTYVSPEGLRCSSTRVEFDHRVPYARGGASDVSNVRLLCRTHNQAAAEEQFGEDFMQHRRQRSGSR